VLSEAGLALPPDPGIYSVEVWTGAEPTQLVTLTFEVPAEP
jgi:hypothetical protein